MHHLHLACARIRAMSLNGWQRLWLLISGLWAASAGLLAYALRPTTVYLPGHPERSEAVLSRMDTRDWAGGDCEAALEVVVSDGRRMVGRANMLDVLAPVGYDDTELGPIVERMIAAGETEDNIRKVMGRFAAKQIVRVGVPLDGQSQDAGLCFAQKVNRDQMTLIAADYHATYRRLVSVARREHLLWAAAIAIFPSLALYGLGAAVAWVRRGFHQPRSV